LGEVSLAEVVGKDEAVVIYAAGIGSSQSGRASARAAIWGFKKVSYFRDRFPGWKAAGHPVEVISK
jgi:3-mercaptopyruvate sulfurtransferase SseA